MFLCLTGSGLVSLCCRVDIVGLGTRDAVRWTGCTSLILCAMPHVATDFLCSGLCQSLSRCQSRRCVRSPRCVPTLERWFRAGGRPLCAPSYEASKVCQFPRHIQPGIGCIQGRRFEGVLWPHQGGAKGLHRFMRHQYPMFGQNARHCLRCVLYIRDLCCCIAALCLRGWRHRGWNQTRNPMY